MGRFFVPGGSYLLVLWIRPAVSSVSDTWISTSSEAVAASLVVFSPIDSSRISVMVWLSLPISSMALLASLIRDLLKWREVLWLGEPLVSSRDWAQARPGDAIA